MSTHVAVDLGATSGRVMVGELRDGRIALAEAHRFPNEPAGSGRQQHWDVDDLLDQTLAGLRRAAALLPADVDPSVGVTAWGVDVGVLGADGGLLAPVQHYRAADPRAGRALLERFGGDGLFRRTGVLPQRINTLFRLRAAVDAAATGSGADVLDGATALLVPDLWCALLTGSRAAERSIASTTGLLSAATGDWDAELVRATGVDGALLPEVVDNATPAGPLRPDVADRIGAARPWEFVRVASHDTASAVAAVSGRPRTAFLSSGTWSLVGVETAAPVTSAAALDAGFTNEAGLAGTTLCMRNLTGLWLLEQALRAWRAQDLDVTVPALLDEAAAVGPTDAAVDVGAPDLVSAGDVLQTITALCTDAGMPPPVTPGEVTRCLLQSLALSYRRTVDLCEVLTGEPVEAVHMTGGGSRNALLRRLTAEACGRPVRYGPVEGTALGSIATQALARGSVTDLAEMQAVLARSTDVGVEPPPVDEGVRRSWRRLDGLVPATSWTGP
ncbi:rhamnulokinase [Geodermatophilus sp. SYSU D01105]